MNKQSEKYRKTKNLGKIHSDRIRYILQAPDVSLDNIQDREKKDLNLSLTEYLYLLGASPNKLKELNFDNHY